jgi:hypothetical protein
MSYEHKIESIEDDILTVVVQGYDNNYLLWQRGLTTEAGSNNGIYFEDNEQIHNGYNQVKECTITPDGIHIVLFKNQLIHFYFAKGFNQFTELQTSLEKIYQGNEDVLAFYL